MRRLGRRLLRRPEPAPRTVEQTFWYRWTKAVMRRVHSRRTGGRRAAAGARRAVPRREVGISRRPRAAAVCVGTTGRRHMRTDFAMNSADRRSRSSFRTSTGLPPAELDRYAAELSRVPDVAAVSAPGGTFAAAFASGPDGADRLEDGSAFFTVGSTRRCSRPLRRPNWTGCTPSPRPAGRDVDADRAPRRSTATASTRWHVAAARGARR